MPPGPKTASSDESRVMTTGETSHRVNLQSAVVRGTGPPLNPFWIGVVHVVGPGGDDCANARSWLSLVSLVSFGAGGSTVFWP